MKNFLMVLMLASVFSGMAFAEEVDTECPMMREMNDRSNPKANIGEKPVAAPKPASSSAQ